jgi:heat shock protein HslJ
MRLALLSLVAAIGGGCATPSVAPPTELLDTYWRAAQIDGQAVVRRPGTRELHIVLRREGSRISGFAGCNNLAGGFRQDRDMLSFGNLAMTRMACVGEGDALEAAFTKALGSTVSWRIAGNTLELRDAQGTTRMILEAKKDSTR